MAKLTQKIIERNASLLQLLLALGLDAHPETSTNFQQHKAKDVLVAIAGLTGTVDTTFQELASAMPSKNLGSRDVISALNATFDYSISPGSYDDIRRVSVQALRDIGVVQLPDDSKDQNDGTKGYALSQEFRALLVKLSQGLDEEAKKSLVDKFVADFCQVKLAHEAAVMSAKTCVDLPDLGPVHFTNDEHEQVLACCFTDLLPLHFGSFKAAYVQLKGVNKYDHKNDALLKRGGIVNFDRKAAPDIIAVDPKNGQVLIVEVVKTINALDPSRVQKLNSLFENGIPAGTELVTACANRLRFGAFARKIAWGTSVWLATEPRHLIAYGPEVAAHPSSCPATPEKADSPAAPA